MCVFQQLTSYLEPMAYETTPDLSDLALPVYERNAPFHMLKVDPSNDVTSGHEYYFPLAHDSAESHTLHAVAAGSEIHVIHYGFGPDFDPTTTPNLSYLGCRIQKVADGTGVPLTLNIANSQPSAGSRFNNVVTVPVAAASTTALGISFSPVSFAPAIGFTITFAQAGWYQLWAIAQLAT